MTIPGLNIQWPWSHLILEGRKKVETRGYPIPKKYLGMNLAIIETPGPKGKAAGILKARIVGVIVFSDAFEYKTKDQWAKDIGRHFVPITDLRLCFYEGKPKWGWTIESVRKIQQKPAPKKRGIIFAADCEI